MINSTRQILAKNTFWLFVGEIVTRSIRFFLVLYITRVIGVTGWGIFSYTFGLASLLMIFSDWGLNNLVVREFARRNEDGMKYLATAFFIRLALILASSAILITIAPWVSTTLPNRALLLVITTVLAVESLRDLLISVHRAIGKIEKEAYLKISAGILTALLGFFVLLKAPSVQNLSYAYLAGSVLGFLIAIPTLTKYLGTFLKHFSRKLILPIFRITLPLFGFGLIGLVMTYTDLILLGWWQSPTDIGLYTSAQRLVQFLLVIPSLIGVATLPILSTVSKENAAEMKKLLEKTISLTLLLGIPMAVGGFILGEEIILLVFGSSYLGATQVFQVFMGMILTMFPTLILANYIFVQNIQNNFVARNTIGAMACLILNLILIPQFGIYGAALATTASNFILLAVLWQKVRQISGFRVWLRLKKIISATLIMSGVIFLLKESGGHVLMQIFIAGSTFLGSLWLIREPMLREAWR